MTHLILIFGSVLAGIIFGTAILAWINRLEKNDYEAMKKELQIESAARFNAGIKSGIASHEKRWKNKIDFS